VKAAVNTCSAAALVTRNGCVDGAEGGETHRKELAVCQTAMARDPPKVHQYVASGK
jgi:hypothetical protein